MRFIKAHPAIFSLILCNIIIIVAVIFVVADQTSKTATLDILTAPMDATVSIAGENYQNGYFKIKPGTYTAIISRDGFDTKSETITLAANATSKAHVYLVNSQSGLDYYLTNKNDFANLKTITSETQKDQAVIDFFAKYDKLASITNQLPIIEWVYGNPASKSYTGGFKISDGTYNADCARPFCLLVTYYRTAYPEKVNQKILNAGYDPNDYQIIYVGGNDA